MSNIFKKSFKYLVLLGLSGIILTLMLIIYLESQLPPVEVLKDIQMQVPLRIYSSDQKLIAEFGEKRRIPIELNEVPKYLIDALLVTEDSRFYSHNGVDITGLMRAIVALIATGDKAQGGSTITMQVARNFFLSRKKTYLRKINEILLALKIERALTKEQILTLYLNKIYLGYRAYGVAAAAQVYYGKKVENLTLDEAAIIAGLPKAPSAINPLKNPKAAEKRRNHVLNRMYTNGLITPAVYEENIKKPIDATYHGPKVELKAPYIAEMVRSILSEYLPDDLYTAGYDVYTTVDSKLQKAANQITKNAIEQYIQRHPENNNKNETIEAAIVSLNPKNGDILALTGGYDFYESKFNRAVQAKRLVGSTIKPFIYSAGLNKGYTAASIFNDAPIVIEQSGMQENWRPNNSSKKFYGPTRLRVALTSSRNLVSIRLLQAMGINYAHSYLSRFNFPPELIPKSLSMSLGTVSVTPLQLAESYASFANGGFKIQSNLINTIVLSSNDKVIFKSSPLTSCYLCSDSEKQEVEKNLAPQIIEPQNAYLIYDMLKDTIKNGTGRRAKVLHRDDIAGKTGSTNDYFDAWFAGFNPELVTITWMGFDNPKSIKEYAATTALPMWINFMKIALQDIPETYLPEPPGIIIAKIDPETGLLARGSQKNAIFEKFIKEHTPKAYAPKKNYKMNSNNDENQNDIVVAEQIF